MCVQKEREYLPLFFCTPSVKCCHPERSEAPAGSPFGAMTLCLSHPIIAFIALLLRDSFGRISVRIPLLPHRQRHRQLILLRRQWAGCIWRVRARRILQTIEIQH